MTALEDHEDGRHVHQLVKGCEGCERIRPAVERDQTTVRYITGGKLIDPPKGWLRTDPPRTAEDDLVIEARLEEAMFEPDLGPDEPVGWWWP